MLTRRMLLRGSASLAATALIGRPANAADGDPIRALQRRIEMLSRRAFNQRGIRSAIAVGVVTPDLPKGQLLFAGGDTLINPFGKKLALDAQTPLEIGSVSKVFTSGIYYMLHGPYEGTLGTSLGSRLRLSKAVADIRLKNLAIYEPGLPQDNRSGAYPPGVMKSVKSLFDYMADFVPPNGQGACYAYSNIGWSLLSMAALRIDSTNTDAFVTQYDKRLKQFCAKFDAPNTAVFHANMKPRLPVGYTRRFVALPARSLYRPCNLPGYGSGGIVSNGADMLRYLLYNMGRLPGGLTDPALVYQQTETFRTAACSATGGSPVTGYGWFHTPIQTGRGHATVLSKNGGVPGFTSWMGFTKWQGTGAPSSHGVFVLHNGPRSTGIGTNAMKLLLTT
ncbi:MAG: serine hydrolase [Rhizobiales bacterium]|nr:serine hydrolase [Hyphomicrobiales bacterium]